MKSSRRDIRDHLEALYWIGCDDEIVKASTDLREANCSNQVNYIMDLIDKEE